MGSLRKGDATTENTRKLEHEELGKVAGGLTQERRAYLDTLIANCKRAQLPMDSALKGCNNLEEMVYVQKHW